MKAFELQIGKIVGVSSQTAWSQVHAFVPKKKEKRQQWGELTAVFALQAKQEQIEISSFGKEIIQRFHETYYSATSESVLKNLKEAVKKITKEYGKQVRLSLVAGVVLDGEKPTLYLLTKRSQAKIYREKHLVTLLNSEKEVKTASGYLKDKDLLVLGTAGFFKKLSNKELRSAFSQKNFERIKEELSALVGAEEENSLMAAAIVQVGGLQETKEQEKVVSSLKKPPSSKLIGKVIQKLTSVFPKIEFPAHQSLRLFLKKRSQIGGRSRKTQLTVAIFLILLLLFSVFLGFRKRLTSRFLEKEKTVFQQADDYYQEGLQVAEVSPTKAKELFQQADELIESYQQGNQEQSLGEEMAVLWKKVEEELQRVSREYPIEADLFLDLGLIRDGFNGDLWQLSGKQVVVLDKKDSLALKVDLESKEGKIVAGGEQVANSLLVASNPGYSFLLSKEKLVGIDDQGEVFDEKEVKELGSVRDMVGFGGNVYLLGKDQVYKFVGLDDGLSEANDYLEKESESLGQAVSLAIDGSIWVLTESGSILKFTRGLPDHFAVFGLDRSFEEATALFTDENSDNLYILDKKNTRVVVIDKEGEYKGSYLWSGIAGTYDLVAIEELNKVFLLTGSRIYELELKNF